MKKMDPVAAIGATGVMDLQKLAKWFADSRLDPNDPNNADIVYMLRVRLLNFYLHFMDSFLSLGVAGVNEIVLP